jgi:hypothetical protein
MLIKNTILFLWASLVASTIGIYFLVKKRCPSCHVSLPLSSHTATDLAHHIFMFSIHDFMDVNTFSVKNVMKCCIGYREQEMKRLLQVQAVADREK